MHKRRNILVSGLFFAGILFSIFTAPLSVRAQEQTFREEMRAEAEKYTRVNAFRHCLRYSKLRERIPLSQVTDGTLNIFEGTVQEAYVGHHVEPNDGKFDCDDESWMRDTLELAGFDISGSTRDFINVLFEPDGDRWVPEGGADNGVLHMNEFEEAVRARNGGNLPGLSPAAAYLLYLDNMRRGCKAEPISSSEAQDYQDDQEHVLDIDWITDTTNTLVEPYYFYIDEGRNRQITVGEGATTDNDDTEQYSCGTLESKINELDDDFQAAAAIAIASGQAMGGDSLEEGAPDDNPECVSNGFELGWIICPFVNGLADTADGVFNLLIQPLLVTTTRGYTDGGGENSIFPVWAGFRNLANILLVVFLLVAVFGQSIGGGLIDAYTAKKILPRLLVAVIMINLSIYFVTLAVDVTNIIGGGIADLIYTPFGELELRLNRAIEGTAPLALGGSVALLFAAATAPGIGVGAVLFGGLQILALFVLLPAVLAFLGILVTLILRKGIIIFLIIVSPIAFALYCLPNTEQYFKKWWSLFSKTLLVYPVIMVMFAIADVLSSLLSTQGTSAGEDVVGDLTSLVLLVLPLFLIPWAFKLAGGAVGGLYATLSGLNKRGVEGIKGNPNDQTSLRNRSRSRFGSDLARQQAALSDAGRELNQSRFRSILGRGVDKLGNVDARMARYSNQEAEIAEAMSKTGRDALRYAGAGYVLEAGETDSEGNAVTERSYFNSKGKQISGNLYKRGKELYGNSLQSTGSQLEYTLRKAQTDKDIKNFRFAYAKNAKANNWTGTPEGGGEMGDVWAQATYPHKDKWLSEWFSSPVPASGNTAAGGVNFNDVSNNAASLDKAVNEQHRAKESFRVGSLRAQDWQAQYNSMTDIQSRLGNPATHHSVTQDEVNRLARMSENLDTMARTGMVTQNQDGEVSVSGATAEASGVISAMFKSRRYASAPLETSSGVFSPTDRVIYDVQAANIAKRSGVDSEQAIQSNGVARAVVSDDRSTIPHQVS